MSLLLQVHNITKQYGNRAALSDVSLDLYQGEIITLLGANGAGKTTLSSIIASLHPPTSGDIIYNGQSIYKDIIAYRSILGSCPQKPNFSSAITVREHLYFAGRYFLMKPNDIESQTTRLMKQFNLNEYANASPSILSGGFKQRLLIARALMHRPRLVILDEPTVALDPHIRRQLWDVIKSLKKENVTVLLTTHYIDEAEILSDRVCVLDRGTVRLIDTPAQFMSNYHAAKLEDVFLQIMEELNT
jgi:ABC-2 type transport system ATP-binding protein